MLTSRFFMLFGSTLLAVACAQGATVNGDDAPVSGASGGSMPEGRGGATPAAAGAAGAASGGGSDGLGGKLGVAGLSGTAGGGTCTDRILTGTETDIDCGGECPNTCALGKKCVVPEDCAIGVCTSGICGTCGNALTDGDETDVDCGGSCDKCAEGLGCVDRGDCATFNCDASTGLCGAAVNCLLGIPDETCPCDCQNENEIPLCVAYLTCYLEYDCDPTSTAECATKTCSVNTLGGGNAPQQAAIAAYKCACK